MSECKTVFFIWFHGQAVKTSPSHGENRGSIPLGTVHTRSEKISFFVKINKLLNLYFVSAFQIHCPRTVKNAPHSCCEVCVMHLHGILLLRTSASTLRSGRRRRLIRWGIDSHH